MKKHLIILTLLISVLFTGKIFANSIKQETMSVYVYSQDRKMLKVNCRIDYDLKSDFTIESAIKQIKKEIANHDFDNIIKNRGQITNNIENTLKTEYNIDTISFAILNIEYNSDTFNKKEFNQKSKRNDNPIWIRPNLSPTTIFFH